MLEYQEMCYVLESGKCPARGISEGSQENSGTDDYALIRESPARMFILVYGPASPAREFVCSHPGVARYGECLPAQQKPAQRFMYQFGGSRQKRTRE